MTVCKFCLLRRKKKLANLRHCIQLIHVKVLVESESDHWYKMDSAELWNEAMKSTGALYCINGLTWWPVAQEAITDVRNMIQLGHTCIGVSTIMYQQGNCKISISKKHIKTFFHCIGVLFMLWRKCCPLPSGITIEVTVWGKITLNDWKLI